MKENCNKLAKKPTTKHLIMTIHIGKIIEREYEESGMKISAFAEKLKTSTRNAYNIFERETIDTGLLQRLGEVLKHNFFQYYYIDKQVNEQPAKYEKENKKMVFVGIEVSETEYKSLINKAHGSK